MKKQSLVMLMLVLLGFGAYAQNQWAGNRAMWLDFGAGYDLADCYDKGAVPFHVEGMGANVSFGATYAWQRCQMQLGTRFFEHELSSPSGADLGLSLDLEFLYRFCDTPNNRWHFRAGGALNVFADMKSIPALQNAQTAVSAFGHVSATGSVEYDFAFNKAKTHPWLTAFGKLSLPIAGAVSRPDYAYISDGVGSVNAEVPLLDGNRIFAKFFAGAQATLGLNLNLPNKNRIGLAYRWDYLTTGKKDFHRFDSAIHGFNLSFMFNIR